MKARGTPAKLGCTREAAATIATIDVMNTGDVFKDFFADPRLRGKTLMALPGTDTNNVGLPLSLFAQPN